MEQGQFRLLMRVHHSQNEMSLKVSLRLKFLELLIGAFHALFANAYDCIRPVQFNRVPMLEQCL